MIGKMSGRWRTDKTNPVSDFTGESKSTVDKTVIVSKSAAIRVFPGSIVSLEETLLRRLSLTSRRMPPRRRAPARWLGSPQLFLRDSEAGALSRNDRLSVPLRAALEKRIFNAR
jgi:hypothetical protein